MNVLNANRLASNANCPQTTGNFATQAELRLLFDTIHSALQAIDFLHAQNADYFLMPVRRFWGRLHLMRYEYNLLMDIYRQVQWMAGENTSSPAKQGHR